MDIFGILNLLGGLALFLYGMSAMGDGLVQLSGGRLEKILEKLTQKKIMAVLLGVSGGDYALPYGVFIVIDVIGAALLLCVTGKCKGKQD